MNADSGSLRAELLGKAGKIVVKLGSNHLAPEGTQVRMERLRSLASQIGEMRKQGRQVILVSSGAIASGMRALALKRRPESLAGKQALAALGQPELMRAYAEAFGERGMRVAQVLLTQEDTQVRKRYINVRNTLHELLSRGIVPVVNENDTVAADEIRMGDNDLLSALVALLADADALIMLTDTDGLLDRHPGRGKAGARIDVVPKISAEMRKAAGAKPGSSVSSGGMATKLQAAEKVMRGGRAALIARGTDRDILLRSLKGEPLGTLFLPAGIRMPSRKRWLAFGVRVSGTVVVDEGARRALTEGGKSLLPKGVIGSTGNFRPGDAVALQDPEGTEFGRGVVRYSSAELAKIMGIRARDIQQVLGYTNGDEVIHRDNLVLTGDSTGKGTS